MTFQLFGAIRLTLLFSTIAITLCASSICAQPQTPKPVEPSAAAFNKGKLLSQRHDYNGAIASYSQAIELNPKWAEVYVERGIALRMSGRLDQAIEDFDKATELNPQATQNKRTVSQAYTNHGQVLAARYEFDRAITDFDKALKLFPDDLRPYFERAEARLFLEDFNGALADYDSYLTKEKGDPFGRARGFLERGLTKHLLGRDAEGVADTKEGMRLADKNAPDLLMSLEILQGRLEAYHQINQQKRKSIG
jgi:tetratricopeptide (TPR) repeat protein